MAIRIYTDSSSDLSPAQAAARGMVVVPLNIVFGEREFTPYVDLSIPEFFQKMRASKELPKTLQATPEMLEGIFRPVVEAGGDLLFVCIADTMSGTYQNALAARQMIGSDHIFIVNSTQVAFALGVLALEAARLRDFGLCACEIAAELERSKENVRLYASLETLEYLRKGGRLSGAGALLGGMLGIKPICSIENGVVVSVAKERGLPRAFDWLVRRAVLDDIDFVRPHVLAQADTPANLAALKEKLLPALAVPDGDFVELDIGPTVGVHAGPGTVGLAYFLKGAK